WHLFRVFGDANGALPLHIRMAAHRTNTSAALTDVAAQQEQIDQHLNVDDAATVLGDAHAVDDHDALVSCVNGSHRLQRTAAQSRLTFNRLPGRFNRAVAELTKTFGVLGNEGLIDDSRSSIRKG